MISAIPALAVSGGFNNTSSMSVARVDHRAVLLPNGEVLVVGGFNATNGYLPSAELYNPSTGKWTLTGSMAAPRDGHDAVLLQNGQVLVAGGINASTPNCASLASAELYNPATGIWTAAGNMTMGRYDFVLTLLSDGEVLAAGSEACSAMSSAEVFNPATGKWSATGSMIGGNEADWAILLQNSEVFVTYNLNLYHPATGTWTTITAPSHHGVFPLVLLPTGNVWLGNGGVFGDDIYDPSTAQWTNFAPPPCTTSKQNCESAGALLDTGKILVAGGVTFVNAQPYPIEETNGLAALLDPATLTWTMTGSLNESRIGETMTVLLNGQVLVAGGTRLTSIWGTSSRLPARNFIHLNMPSTDTRVAIFGGAITLKQCSARRVDNSSAHCPPRRLRLFSGFSVRCPRLPRTRGCVSEEKPA